MHYLILFILLKNDEEIKNENHVLNVSGYTSPKMFIYSGHDGTLNGEELFIIKYLVEELD